jgi:DNA-binding MarR family transcriptional regulator
MYIHVKARGSVLHSVRAPFDLYGTGSCGSFNFRRTARAVTRLYDQAFQSSGIRSTQFSILVAVAKTQPASIGALSAVLIIDSTTLTRSLGRLEKVGILSVSARGAKRQRFVSLTPKGEKLLADSLPAWRAAQERFVQAMGSEYWAHLRSELERLAHVAVQLESSQPEPVLGLGPSGPAPSFLPEKKA